MAMVEKVKIAPGEKVAYAGNTFYIKRLLDLQTVLLEPTNGSTNYVRAEIKFLAPVSDLENQQRKEVDLSSIHEDDWLVAQNRYAIIRPIITGEVSPGEVNAIAKAAALHISTIYRWIERYNQTGKISSLVPSEKSGGKGKSRLSSEIEAIIQASIEEVYLNRQRKSIKKVVEEVMMRCKNASIKPPHPNTIQYRIRTISEEEKLKQRYGASRAKEVFEPTAGRYSEAAFPYSVIQIDHTKVDIILVDEHHRQPIGRPWITVAIDVFSRMVAGFYVSFDPPGAIGTGMCLAHAILPKEMWLAEHEVTGDWPCWGVMRTIHADNAKEFRGNMLRKAAEEYGINLEWRPVKEPRWGGHIERLVGTLMNETHTLPGTTFSNPNQRKDYDSEKMAALTLFEFEKWLTTFIVNVYHNKVHKGIGTSPLALYNEGVFGSPKQVGSGLPERIFNERKLNLDFLPYVERTIQDYGVIIDHIQYYHGVLRKWINAIERGSGKARVKRKFIFKRDPRDISVVYFYDPEIKEYFEIPYRNTAHPPITIWEYREIERKLAEEGKANIDEAAIFEGYEKLKELEAAAVNKTQVTRRLKNTVKRTESLSKSVKSNFQEDEPQIETEEPSNGPIKPFDDLDNNI